MFCLVKDSHTLLYLAGRAPVSEHSPLPWDQEQLFITQSTMQATKQYICMLTLCSRGTGGSFENQHHASLRCEDVETQSTSIKCALLLEEAEATNSSLKDPGGTHACAESMPNGIGAQGR